jgi:hypothetical protein
MQRLLLPGGRSVGVWVAPTSFRASPLFFYFVMSRPMAAFLLPSRGGHITRQLASSWPLAHAHGLLATATPRQDGPERLTLPAAGQVYFGCLGWGSRQAWVGLNVGLLHSVSGWIEAAMAYHPDHHRSESPS